MSKITTPSGVLTSYNFASSNEYRADGTIVRNTSANPFSYTAQFRNLSDVVLSGFTFDGNGLYFENCRNIIFEDCTIMNARRSHDNHQAIYYTGLSNALFNRVKFKNVSHAVMGYGANGVTFRESSIEDSGYGIKIQLGNGSRNLLIDRLLCQRMQSTMGVEIQSDDSDIDGIILRDSAYVNPILNDDDNLNKHAFAWSLPGRYWGNCRVERCYTDGRRNGDGRGSRPGWLGVRLAHEVGGTRPVHTQNWIRYVNDPGGITSSTAAQCFDNRVQNCIEQFNFAAPANGKDAEIGSRVENNGPNVPLPEFGGWSLVGVSSGGGDPVPTPPPVNPREVETLKALLAAAQAKIEAGRKALA